MLILLILLLDACSPKSQLYIQMGVPKEILSKKNDSVIRIFFDRNGCIYPDVKNVKSFDDGVKENNSLIWKYYENQRETYRQICENERITPNNSIVLDGENDPLQAKLISNYIGRINEASLGKKLVFIVHGYNSHPTLGADGGSSSFYDNTRKILTASQGAKNIQFVEIYWNGLSKEGGGSNVISKLLNSSRIWKNAQASAGFAAIELRRIFSGLKVQDVFIITHSHGAAVVTNALFNVRKVIPKAPWEFNFLAKYQKSIYASPTQQFHVAMLAPAIPGMNVFDEYCCRTVGDAEVCLSERNLHFIVGFNRHDPVTTKFGAGSAKAGSTTLAARPRELARVREYFNYDNAVIESVDFSRTLKGDKQKSHDSKDYLANPNLKDFMEKLFGQK